MNAAIIIAVAIAIPIILFPVALVWYVNIGGITMAVREARQRRTTAVEEK